MDDGEEFHEFSEAARRGLQRATVHLMKAAIEVVAGLSAFLEEMGSNSPHPEEGEDGPQRIALE